MREKSLFENSIYNVIYKLLNAIFPLISATYVSHVILASGVGKVSSAQNIAQYFVIIAALGIPNYGIREISKLKKESVERNKTFSELFVINFISTCICAIIYYAMIHFTPEFEQALCLYESVGFLIVLNIFNVDWFYQGMEEYGYIAKRSFIVKIASLVALFLFVKKPGDYITYAIIHVMAVAGNYLFNVINLKKYKVKLELHGNNLKRHLRPVFVLLCTSIAIELYTLLDTTMLTILCDSENVGYYTNSIKIVKMVITVITAIGGVLLPRLSYYAKNNRIKDCSLIVNKVLSILIYLFLPCGVGIILVADPLVPLLFGKTFYPAIATIRIAALLIYALGFSNLFGTQVLLTFYSEKKLFLCTFVGGISNIIMNLFLIPIFKQNGAAVASVISEALVTIMTFVFSKKYIEYSFNVSYILKTVLSTVIMAVYVISIKLFISQAFLSLIFSIVGGVIVYFISSIAFKNEVVFELFHMLKKGERKKDI